MDKFDKFMVIFLITCGCIFTYHLAVKKSDEYKCSNSQLHQVIAEVEKCTKQNVICSEKMKDEILRSVCR